MAKSDEKPKLTPMEELFVEQYCSETNGNATEAARRAGYSRSVVEKAYELPRKHHIAQAIDNWREARKRSFWVTESQILQRMWEEANFYDQGATHAGRISALVNLGKHLGMFGEGAKKDGVKGAGNTYNIINYASADPMGQKVSQAVKEKEAEVLEALESPEEDEGALVEIKDYSKSER